MLNNYDDISDVHCVHDVNDDDDDHDYDEYDDIYIMVKCMSVTFLLISFSPISGHFWV